ncbi:hypothetical protein HUO13_26975 [Saccharopolyspora erythraea]|uniref:hypothetical protein n=1 Tax=Saccharopolyspora erythraea TaxID=1836 RepID=UPI001BACC1B9|nr:hypothetical protein [Saccharopolyspora erythraea]QUH03973.1 hypothetical protein HUO13_26975 [Saccharopolyspora erythraea]
MSPVVGADVVRVQAEPEPIREDQVKRLRAPLNNERVLLPDALEPLSLVEPDPLDSHRPDLLDSN